LAAEHLDVGEEARRRGMAAMDRLIGLALAAIERAMYLERRRAADGAQAAPERG